MSNLQRIGLGVSVALYRDISLSSVCLIARQNPPKKGLLCFPGGKLEYGESLLTGMARQLREQTGYQGRPLPDHFITQLFQPAHYLLVTKIFIAGRKHEPLQPIKQKWYPVKQALELPSQTIIESVRKVLSEIQSKKEQLTQRWQSMNY